MCEESEKEPKQKSPDKLKANDTTTKTDNKAIEETLKEERKEPEEFQKEIKDAWNVNKAEFLMISAEILSGNLCPVDQIKEDCLDFIDKISALIETIQTDLKRFTNLEHNVVEMMNAIVDCTEGNYAKEVETFLRVEITSLSLKMRMKNQKRLKQK